MWRVGLMKLTFYFLLLEFEFRLAYQTVTSRDPYSREVIVSDRIDVCLPLKPREILLSMSSVVSWKPRNSPHPYLGPASRARQLASRQSCYSVRWLCRLAYPPHPQPELWLNKPIKSIFLFFLFFF